MTPRTLYVCVSPHGFGHISQTAPVVNELFRRQPDLKVVIETTAPLTKLQSRFAMPFTHVPHATDFGMVMENALTASRERSHAAYVALHAELPRHIAESKERIAAHEPAVVLCNAPYIPIAAARQLGVPVVAMCCLNWADIYRDICGEMPSASAIHDEILSAYRAADVFITPAPTMPMPELRNTIPNGPVAALGKPDRARVRAVLEVPGEDRIVTISMGGIDTDLDLRRWPVVPGVTWLVDGAIPQGRSDMRAFGDLSMTYLDAMCSVDAIVTKPGYGTFAEAACNGIPVVYVPRRDWPEAPYLARWLREHATCIEIDWPHVFSDRLAGALATAWRAPKRSPVPPSGVTEAADVIERYLGW